MAKEKTAPLGLFFRELFQAGLYKRSQGRIARQVTFAVLALGCALAAWRLRAAAMNWEIGLLGVYSEQVLQYLMPITLAFVGVWIAYRVVNIPSFADFLIAVEAEMNKVSWPTRTELFRSSLVVILLLFFLAAILFAYDVFWRQLLSLLQIIRGGD
jgi:preprotein translocase subunit SecE